ncbi:MAG: diaminopimelate epimerase [Pseudomonadota bacterium]
MPSLKFAKMQGLGNDFMIVDAISQNVSLNQFQVPQLSHRHLGIGFDQLLIIEPSTIADFGCRIMNADGSEAEQCGNGLRCVASFIAEKGLSTQKQFTIATRAGIYNAVILPDNQVQIEMGLPCFEPTRIPFLTDSIKNLYPFNLNEHDAVQLSVLSMGNPHAVLQVDALNNFPVTEIGRQIAADQAFPQSTNVGFMEIIDRRHIRLRTFERGSGETHACGSNACAAVVSGIINNTLDNKVKVQLKFGELAIEWPEKTKPVLMTGPAVHIFDGILNT